MIEEKGLRRSTRLRREVYIQSAKALLTGNIDDLHKIPYDMTRQGVSRCCIHRDRAVLRKRVISALGFPPETVEDEVLLPELARSIDPNEAENGNGKVDIIRDACSSCAESRYQITELCRGCLDRSCSAVCPRNAVEFVAGRAVINQEACVKCGKCQNACAYNAVVRSVLPCIEACPVGAITRNGNDPAEIDKEACINCGRCVTSCPFGAPVSPSQLGKVSTMLGTQKEREHVALIAPSIQGQLPGSYGQIINGLRTLGFTRVVEAAAGADMTIEAEAEELIERLEDGQKFMTSSCCPAWVSSVERVLPQVAPYVSHTPSPMVLAARAIAKCWEGSSITFIGPCIAKKLEAQNSGIIDRVLTFEEIGAMIVAAGIEIPDLEESVPEVPDYTRDAGDRYGSATTDAHKFAMAGGVAQAVLHELESSGKLKDPVIKSIAGLDKKSLNLIKSYGLKPERADFSFLEVMCCSEGCVGGPGAICSSSTSVKAFSRENMEQPVTGNQAVPVR